MIISKGAQQNKKDGGRSQNLPKNGVRLRQDEASQTATKRAHSVEHHADSVH